jgi:hypothetical protein
MDCDIEMSANKPKPKSDDTLWMEVSDISGEDLWESKILGPAGGLNETTGELRSWDIRIPDQFESVIDALEKQRYQGSRLVFLSGIHIMEGQPPAPPRLSSNPAATHPAFTLASQTPALWHLLSSFHPSVCRRP